MIDWISVIREKDGKPFAPWKECTVALGAASPGNLGGVRGLNHLRAVLASIGSLVISEQVLVANAKNAFDQDGNLTSERSIKTLGAMCKSHLRLCQ